MFLSRSVICVFVFLLKQVTDECLKKQADVRCFFLVEKYLLHRMLSMCTWLLRRMRYCDITPFPEYR